MLHYKEVKYQGETYYLYAYDVAEEIQIRKIEKILSKRPTEFKVRPERNLPRDFVFRSPLEISVPSKRLAFENRVVQLRIRVYEVGVISLIFKLPFETDSLSSLRKYHNPTLDNAKTLDHIATQYVNKVKNSLEDYFFSAASSLPEPEAYTVFRIKEFESLPSPESKKGEFKELAALLTDWELSDLSDHQITEATRTSLSFSKNDLIIIDWEAAVLFDRSEYIEDTIFVMEVANLQLEELKILDQKLDRTLDQAYDDLTAVKGFFFRAKKVLASLRAARMDVTKLNDEISNIGKFFGDWYLARVYLNLKSRFHLDEWHQSVHRKLLELDRLYSIFRSEINERKMVWLEAAIVILFIIDLIGLFFFKA